jgi:arginine decarboxylase
MANVQRRSRHRRKDLHMLAPVESNIVPLRPHDTEFPSHRQAPMIDALRTYQKAGTTPFSTPGHKRGRLVDDEAREILGERLFDADVWLNTGDCALALEKAQELAADAWMADRAFYLVNGSSGGNQAVCLAHLNPGDEVIVARDAHKSLLSGLILTGAKPVFVSPRLHPELNLSMGVHPDDIRVALRAHPKARLVAVTSPNYHGIASNLPEIVKVAHKRDVPVYVDEAWGAHLRFHPALPLSAIESDADASVISAHKTLPAMGQSSILLQQGDRIDPAKLSAAVRMTQSTSLSIPMLVSLDSARRQMALHGWALMELTLALAERARRRLRQVPGIALIDGSTLGDAAFGFDQTRLVIDVGGLGLTGVSVEKLLRRRFGVAPEMSDDVGVVCLVTLADNRDSIDRLVSAFEQLSAEFGTLDRSGRTNRNRLRSAGEAIASSEPVMTPRDAFFSPSRSVPLPAAIGEVAAELVVPYPPGIPVLVPGERITWDKLLYLAEVSAGGIAFSGTADSRLLTIRVVDAA